ncbi:NAD-dependent epimerase/dehydratase family protein [Rubripirellula amarantea]|nr:NAD-dependent epimerase/dehydratase family protein [Rubripirellula amarantea]
MRILVTGCGGFLGSEIVRQCLSRGDNVIGLSRRSYPHLIDAGMIERRGDLADREFVVGACQDVDAVIHTAAVAGVWGKADYYERNNVTATRNVIDACRANEIRHLIFTSSPSVTFAGDHQRGIDETAPYPDRWLCHYPRTKAIAEQAVMSADEPGGLRTVSLRPHLIWGNNDPHLLPRIVAKAKSGRLRIVGEGNNLVDTVHVVNAAASHLDALDTLGEDPERAAGRAYFIAQDEPVDCWAWIAKICKIAGVPAPSKRISYQAARRLGHGLELAYRALGLQSEPPMTRFVAAQLAKDHYFDISAAKERLGYRVRLSMAEGLENLEVKN